MSWTRLARGLVIGSPPWRLQVNLTRGEPARLASRSPFRDTSDRVLPWPSAPILEIAVGGEVIHRWVSTLDDTGMVATWETVPTETVDALPERGLRSRLLLEDDITHAGSVRIASGWTGTDGNVFTHTVVLAPAAPIDVSQFATREEVATAIAAAIADIPEPDLSGYATDEELAAAIAALPGPPDLSGYATDEELAAAVEDMEPRLPRSIMSSDLLSARTLVGFESDPPPFTQRPILSFWYPTDWSDLSNSPAEPTLVEGQLSPGCGWIGTPAGSVAQVPLIQTVNGAAPDEAGNVEVSASGGGGGGPLTGTGSPQGVVSAPVGTEYVDTAATLGAVKWIKASGTGSTGWRVLYGDTGWRDVRADFLSLSKATGGVHRLRVRREGSRVWVAAYVTGDLPQGTWTATGLLPLGMRPDTTANAAGEGSWPLLAKGLIAPSINNYMPLHACINETDGALVLVRPVNPVHEWYGEVSFSVSATWPTSLPGTPIN